jgi:hypothetical protein
MELKEIVSLSGKGGLFKIIGPTRSGLILESMDDHKTKLVTAASSKVSVLDEISIYVTSKENTVPLGDVLKKIKSVSAVEIGTSADATESELRAFMIKVLPDYDDQRVYISDIKKLIRWYLIIEKYAPEILAA